MEQLITGAATAVFTAVAVIAAGLMVIMLVKK